MTVHEVDELMKMAITNLQTISGFFGNPQSGFIRLGLLILNYLPARVSTYARRALNRPEQSPVADTPDAFQIITKIVSKTSHLHKKDEVIPFDLLDLIK